MTLLYFALLLAGLVCFLLTAFGARFPRVDLLGLGLAFWIAVPLLHYAQAL